MKILIVRGGGIGDLILSIPSINSIKKISYDPEITILSNWDFKQDNFSPIDLYYRLGLIKRHIYFGHNSYNRLFYIPAFIKKILLLRKEEFDISICLRHSLRTFSAKIIDYILFKILVGAKIGIGFFNSSQLKDYKHNNESLFPMVKESNRLLYVLLAEGFKANKKDMFNYNFKYKKDEKFKIQGLFEKQNILNDKIIVSCPFSGRVDAIWPIENYREAYKKIIYKDYYIFVTGSESEFSIAKDAFDDLGPQVINICGQLSILELALLFQKSKIYFGNDTGPMHLASLVRIPCVAIFSSTNNPGKFYPHNENNIIYQVKNNLKEIKVSNVVDGIMEAIENNN